MERTCWKACAISVICATAIVSHTQVFTTLANFDGTDGAAPLYVSLVQGADGSFYGTTFSGGSGSGTVFKVTPAGTLTTLYNFCDEINCDDGGLPIPGLLLAIDGNFYGTTDGFGGPGVQGTVFKITPGGLLTTLDSFDTTGGYDPVGALVQGTDGNFYGTAQVGGVDNNGTVFKVTPGGTLTTLHSFDSTDGASPQAGLVQTTDGTFYGTTYYGGDLTCNAPVGCGTVFKMTQVGTVTTLHMFHATDGEFASSLVQSVDGNFYGTTSAGGNLTCEAPYGCGTVFRMSAGGALTKLHSFDGTDGLSPYGVLVQATDGNFYGTTYGGGGSPSCTDVEGCGTVFEITPTGTLTVLHSFCVQVPCTDGGNPIGGLVQGTDGILYGTASGNRANNDGTVFSLNMGFAQFVRFVRSSGYVGQTGPILGQDFTGTSNVSLNGTSVPFTVKSDTLITATVPVGATTGSVMVTTPSGTLSSNVPFRVLPQLLSFTPTSGPVGTQVTITGVSLTQTTGVGFGDYTPAQFTVNSDTQVTATVPSGAKTGPVGIQTQGGIAISTQTFTMTQ